MVYMVHLKSELTLRSFNVNRSHSANLALLFAPRSLGSCVLTSVVMGLGQAGRVCYAHYDLCL